MSTSRSHTDRQRRRLTATEVDLERLRQRALLVGVGAGSHSLEEAEASLDELALLADTAGAVPVDRVLQRRRTPDPATYFGKGKIEELRELVAAHDIDVVIVDDELTPAQQRNLEGSFKVDVVDRVALILDIFAQHATSQDGAVQVELAQLRYRLPRLRGRGLQLSQQGGGIGTRGPGETQLEVDRRRLLRRIQRLERDLRELGATRDTQRKARRRRALPSVALVGYTNAGKSTLLNRLTDAGVLVQNQLFSTLDPTTRRLRLPGGEVVLLSDTVGFVRRLPHQLVEGFAATLEETLVADLVLHVVDASASEERLVEQIAAVDAVLHEIGADDMPRLLVLNKIDAVDDVGRRRLENRHPEALQVSALDGEGLDGLRTRIAEFFAERFEIVRLLVPYTDGARLNELYALGTPIEEREDTADGVMVVARLPRRDLPRFTPFVVR